MVERDWYEDANEADPLAAGALPFIMGRLDISNLWNRLLGASGAFGPVLGASESITTSTLIGRPVSIRGQMEGFCQNISKSTTIGIMKRKETKEGERKKTHVHPPSCHYTSVSQ